jgi:hypothetical protein
MEYEKLIRMAWTPNAIPKRRSVMKRTMRRLLVVPLLAIGSLTLIACDEGMSGKYGNKVSDMAGMTVEFKSGSKAYVTMPGGAMMEFKYEMDGDKVILKNQVGNMVLTRNRDGTLSGSPMDVVAGPMKKLN